MTTKSGENSKHKSPSRLRYELNNPVLSVRVPKELYDVLKQFLRENGLSTQSFLAIALNKLKPDYTQAYKKGYSQGYEKGKNDFQILFPCECGIILEITPNSEAHKAIISFIRQGDWSHEGCRKQTPQQPQLQQIPSSTQPVPMRRPQV